MVVALVFFNRLDELVVCFYKLVISEIIRDIGELPVMGRRSFNQTGAAWDPFLECCPQKEKVIFLVAKTYQCYF